MKRMVARLLCGLGLAVAWCAPGLAQADAGCGASAYRVIAARWDAVLRRSWELREDCAHPEWPARLVAGNAAGPFVRGEAVRHADAAPVVQPLLVHAGDAVRLWMQDRLVRIEMSGVAEGSARMGERVVVRTTRQSDDVGLTVERVAGIVRGAGDVEMER
jgi:hypothetical protein